LRCITVWGASICGSTTLQHVCPAKKIHRCFERVNQLLSLLVPVSDINRVAVGMGGAWRQALIAILGAIGGISPPPKTRE
jgi:hypothetical protein